MGIYERSNAPLNRFTTAKYLRLLFPDLKEEKAEAMITDLLRKGELESEENRERDDVGGAWTISFESWARFENKILWKREEARKEKLKELQKLIKQTQTQQTQMLKELIKLVKELQVKVGERDKEEWRK